VNPVFINAASERSVSIPLAHEKDFWERRTGGRRPVPEILSSITTAIALGKQLIAVGEKTKNAQLKNLVADLLLKLAEIKTQLASVMEENTRLKSQISNLESTKGEGEVCPKCRKSGWRVTDSRPDPIFGEAGTARRTYRCDQCGFSEEKLVT
jgi:hypothetical protein